MNDEAVQYRVIPNLFRNLYKIDISAKASIWRYFRHSEHSEESILKKTLKQVQGDIFSGLPQIYEVNLRNDSK